VWELCGGLWTLGVLGVWGSVYRPTAAVRTRMSPPLCMCLCVGGVGSVVLDRDWDLEACAGPSALRGGRRGLLGLAALRGPVWSRPCSGG